MDRPIRVLMITSEWPTPEKPYQVPFIVRQVDFLRRAGVDVQVMAFRGGKDPKNYMRAWRKAQAQIRSGQFDLVHAQWGQSGLLALPKHLPLVVTFRGSDIQGITGSNGKITSQGRVLKNLSRVVAKAADQVIVVSENLGRAISYRDYHIIPSGLDLDLFCPTPITDARGRLGLDPTRYYVLFAGSINNPGKRYALAKQAVEVLKQEMDIELLVATSVTHDQVPDYMNASNVLLMTSLYEGSPNVVKEALACNLPVISTDVGDVRQRIARFPGCRLISDDSPQAIADLLRDVLIKNQRLDSRASVLDLDEKILTNKVIDVYRQALSGN